MVHQATVSGGILGHTGVLSVPPAIFTIDEKIRCYAKERPEQPAFVSSGFAPLSYRRLQHQIDEVRAALRRAGFGRSARIAVAMPNGPQAALAIVAASCSAVSVPLNPRQTLQEIQKCLMAVRPDAVLLMKDSDSAARQAAESSGITIIEAVQAKEDCICFNIVEPPATGNAKSEELDEPNPGSTAFILQTSGTTSDSKLIPTSHRNMLAAAARVQTWFNLTPIDRCLCVSPVFYAHGLHVAVYATLLSGGSIAFPRDASRFEYSEWFDDLRPTWYSAGPTLHRLVFEQTKSKAAANAGHSLRFIVSGGAPLPPDVLKELQQTFGVPVLEHYGSSEGLQICANQLAPGRSRSGTCGIPWPDTIKIVAEDGHQLPPGEQGEVLVGGPTVVSGYLDAPELTRGSFVDGWFRSGDIGSIDHDGFLILHGRMNDLINRGGEKISPIEVDEILLHHPAVAEAAAFSVPHSRLGEDVAAAVVLRPGMKTSPLELRKFLQDQIASFKVPRRIVIQDQLPRGATGKVLRRRLTQSYTETMPAQNPPTIMSIPHKTTTEAPSVEQLMELWQRLLKYAPVSLDDDFFEKGGDSLLAMEMLAELALLTGETIPASALLDGPTIRQMALKLSERNNFEPRHLVQIHPSGRQTPLILFHGDFIWGGGPLTLGLANLLGADQPILVIIPHGAGDDAIPQSIEAMAIERLPLIMKAQPEGPYRLCGNCLGGIVAFEVARLLLAAGKDVEVVFMIDPPTINARKSMQLLFSTMRRTRPVLGPVVDRAMAWTWYRSTDFQKFWNVSWARRGDAIKNLILGRGISRSHNTNRTLPAIASPSSKHNIEPSPFGQFTEARTMRYAAAMSNYIPKPLAVRVMYISIDYGIGGWRRISPDVKVIKMPGTHYQLDVPKIAGALRSTLDASKGVDDADKSGAPVLKVDFSDDVIG
jgi:acyl-CoA synthetase (AMP-forming)/AMP-acid ligase II